MSKLYNFSKYLKAYRDTKGAPIDCVIISGYCRDDNGNTSYCNISIRNVVGKEANFSITKHPHVSDCYILKLNIGEVEVINRDEREQSKKNKQPEKKKSATLQPFDDELIPF